MSSTEIKEILEKQLQLLSEESTKCRGDFRDSDELLVLTQAMDIVVRALTYLI